MNWFSDLLQAVPATLGLWALALILGMALAVPVTVARMSRFLVLRAMATVWIEVLRGIPSIVWLFLIFFGFGFYSYSPTALVTSVVALGGASSAYFAEVYRSGLQSVPAGQREALKALGMPATKGTRLVVLPQALPIIIDGSGSFAILLLKETALASIIGVVEIMNVANFAVTQGINGMLVFFTVGVIYAVLCLPIGFGAHFLSRGIATRSQVASGR